MLKSNMMMLGICPSCLRRRQWKSETEARRQRQNGTGTGLPDSQSTLHHFGDLAGQAAKSKTSQEVFARGKKLPNRLYFLFLQQANSIQSTKLALARHLPVRHSKHIRTQRF